MFQNKSALKEKTDFSVCQVLERRKGKANIIANKHNASRGTNYFPPGCFRSENLIFFKA